MQSGGGSTVGFVLAALVRFDFTADSSPDPFRGKVGGDLRQLPQAP